MLLLPWGPLKQCGQDNSHNSSRTESVARDCAAVYSSFLFLNRAGSMSVSMCIYKTCCALWLVTQHAIVSASGWQLPHSLCCSLSCAGLCLQGTMTWRWAHSRNSPTVPPQSAPQSPASHLWLSDPIPLPRAIDLSLTRGELELRSRLSAS